jgi:TolB-like protein/tetratricopeptide (TPR) repeat protein
MSERASKLGHLLAELKRRKVYRVAVVYAVVAFAIWQVAEITFPALHLPEWVLTFVVVIVIIGFPIALVLAWALEVTPEGIRRTAPLPPAAGRDGDEAAAPVSTTAEPQPASIAVLPFSDMSPERDQEYFCDGMAEELINALTKVKELRVAARTSSFQFKGRSEDVREIARSLGVRSVLEGSVRRAGDRLRVTAQLVSAEDGYHLWSETYERQLEDVFAIQDEISRAIVDTLRPTLVGRAEPRLVKPSTESTEAYDLCLKGRYYWHQRYKYGLEMAMSYFQRAIEIDPDYALPYTGIADSYVTLAMYGFLPVRDAGPKAKAAATRALELDDELGEAHASLGWVQFACDWDWASAEENLERAIELSPSNAEVRTWLGLLYGAQGRFTEGLRQMDRARDLDPLSSYVAAMTGAVYRYVRDADQAIHILEGVVKKEPGYAFALFILAAAYGDASRHADAVATGERLVAATQNASLFKGQLANFYLSAGAPEKARAIVDELNERSRSEYVSPLPLAWALFPLGETEAALDRLAEAVDEHSPLLVGIHQDPAYDPIRSHPRYAQLASRVGSGVVKSYSPSD